MSSKRALLPRRAGALALRSAVAGLAALPQPIAYGLADAAAPLVLRQVRRRERRVGPRGRGIRRNLRIAYRERLAAPDADRLLRAWARHVTHLVVDVARMRRLHAGNLHRVVDARDMEILRKLAAEGRGVICVSGHIGVWELCPRVSGLTGLPVTSVARALPGTLDDLAVRLRNGDGARTIPQRGAVRRLLACLRRGGTVGLLADEDVPDRPVFAPFLGTLAATTRVPAFLQRVTGAPIAVVTVHRTARGRFRLRVWEVIRRDATLDDDAHERDTMAAVNAALSRAIEAHPEQWLWGARRFRTRPPGEVPGPDGLPPPAPARPPAVR